MSNNEDNKFSLGERVHIRGGTVPLPHPAGGDPFAEADNADIPFTSVPLQGAVSGNSRATAYDPNNAQQPVTQPDADPTLPQTAKRPVPLASKPSIKETKTLARFRETFGIKRIDVEDVVIARKHPKNPDEVVSFSFGLRGLSFEDHQWALEKAVSETHNPAMVKQTWALAVCAIGICHIDGDPIWSAFGLEAEDPADIKDPMYPCIGLRFQAATAFYDELKTTMYDIVGELYSTYESLVDGSYHLNPKKLEEDEKEEEDSVPFLPSESDS